MSVLKQEVENWNSPALYAYLIWRFTHSYSKNQPEQLAPNGLYAFLVTGILSNFELANQVTNHKSDLKAFARYFERQNKMSLLFGLQDQIQSRKKLTLSSLDCACAHGLLTWDETTGELYAAELAEKPKLGNGVKPATLTLGNKAETLGKWFSELSIRDVAILLRVVF